MSTHIVALSGGIGGAKLAFGLSRILEPDELTVIANTGDDFEHLGLSISPDIDTLIYTLTEVSNRITGWGRAAETWSFKSALEELGVESWFSLGDKDLALHVRRTQQLRAGRTLSDITAEIADALGLCVAIAPMTDASVRTKIVSDTGTLDFQDYFVRLKCGPIVRRIEYEGATEASPSPRFKALLSSNDVTAFVICPSNPYLSIDPILSLPGVRQLLRNNKAPVIAVSPIVGGQSLKGPTAKIMSELGVVCSTQEIAKHYADILDALIINSTDSDDRQSLEHLGLTTEATATIMKTDYDRIALAKTVVAMSNRLMANKLLNRGARHIPSNDSDAVSS